LNFASSRFHANGDEPERGLKKRGGLNARRRRVAILLIALVASVASCAAIHCPSPPA
jgi:hypothetical protein